MMKQTDRFRLAAWWLLLASVLRIEGETVTLTPIADTMIHEFYPSNNFGGYPHVSAGSTGSPKPNTTLPYTTRGLFKFDLSRIPKSSRITSAVLALKVTFASGVGPNSTFELRRVFQSWGEGKGDSTTGVGNSGAPAAAGDATWLMRTSPSAPWSQAGGVAPTDFSSEVSATAAVGGIGAYSFGSNTNLVADVQSWVDNTGLNFGWMLISQSENVPQTARRFGSREDASNAATLVVNYEAPELEFRISSISLESTKVVVRWTGGRPPYQVQQKQKVSETIWVNVGTALNSNSATFPAGATDAIFRIASGGTVQALARNRRE